MPTIAIDARMINHSGIGTYMKNLISVLLEDYHLILLGAPLEIKKHIKSGYIEIINFQSPIYSVSEQMMYPLIIPGCDLLLSTHYNIPLFPIRAKKRIVIIYDANHLAFYNHLSIVQKLYTKLMMNGAVKLSDTIITISEFSKSEILKYLSVDPLKIKVVHFGIDPEMINLELKKAPSRSLSIGNVDEKFLLFVGNVKPHKNLINLLRAFEILLQSGKDYKLVIVGKKAGFITGDKEVFEYIELNKLLKENIIFTGHIENRELYNYYRKASVFIFPSLYEGFGIPPLEAMICGCPVIASDLTAIPEICGDAVLYIKALDPADIAEKINILTVDKSLRNELVKKGNLQVSKFPLTKFSHNLKEVIKEVINKG
jgi:glycosyltransferase involved in cell wall biosynthesis